MDPTISLSAVEKINISCSCWESKYDLSVVELVV